MTRLSLARIMYGTNEDIHTSTAISAKALASLAVRSSGEAAVGGEGVSAAGTLSQLLHKAWAVLHHKD